MKYKKLLIYSPTKQIFETALANKVADEFAIAFIEEPRMIWAQGIYYPCPFTKEEITQMVTELQEKDTELETLIRTLVDTLNKRITDLTNNIDNYTINGKKISTNPVLTKTDVGLSNVTNDAQVKRSEMSTPEGVATLDNFGLVPIDQLFLKQADFYQFQDIAVIFDGTLTGKGQIIFNTRSNKFVINQRGNGIFTNWDNADEYGTASPEGRIPFPGKIYTCEKDGKSYIWNDTTLVETEIDESRIRPPYGIVMQSYTFFCKERRKSIIFIAVIANSSPLFPMMPPDLSSACCRLFVVKTPKTTGTSLSLLSAEMPCVTPVLIYSK